MKKQIPDINKRFLQVMEENDYSGYKFAKEFKEVSESKMTHIRSGRNQPSTEMISALLSKFKNINSDWLLTGEGQIKYSAENPRSVKIPTKKNTNEKEKKVPYYDIDVTSHITTSFSDIVEEPSFYVDYQPFNDCTAYVNNFGDSMFPKYKNGEKLAVRQVFNFDIIMWGETYLVCTNQNADNYKAVKDIHPHEDESKIILRSSNPSYKGDTIINKEDIVSMFAVKGKISQNFI